MEVIVELNEADQIRERVLSLVQDISYAVEGIGYAEYIVSNSFVLDEIREALSYYTGFDATYHKAMQLLDNLKEHNAFDELQYVFEVEHRLKEHIAVYNEVHDKAHNSFPLILAMYELAMPQTVSNMTDEQYNEERKYISYLFDSVFHDAMELLGWNTNAAKVTRPEVV